MDFSSMAKGLLGGNFVTLAASPSNPLKDMIGAPEAATEGARAYPGGSSNFKTYGVIIDDGYGTRRMGQTPEAYITAETPQQARAAFLARHRGAYYAKPDSIRATKIQDTPIENPDQHAPDWLPGGKYYK